MSQNSQRYGGTLIILPPHYQRRIITAETHSDPRNLGRFCQLTIQGKQHTKLTVISSYMPPTTTTPNGVRITQKNILERERIDADPYTLLSSDLAATIKKARQGGSEIIIGADFQTDIRNNSKPLTSTIWGNLRPTGIVDPTVALNSSDAVRTAPTYVSDRNSTTIDAIY